MREKHTHTHRYTLTEIHLKAINHANALEIESALRSLRSFLLIKDSLQHLRIEWILGIAQVLARRLKDQPCPRYGLELVDKIDDEAASYDSSLTMRTN